MCDWQCGIADIDAVSVSHVWYMFSAEFLHPWETFLRRST